MAQDQAIEIQQVIFSTHPGLPAIIDKPGNGEWVCRLTEPMRYFFWSVQDWYDYLALYKRQLQRFTHETPEQKWIEVVFG